MTRTARTARTAARYAADLPAAGWEPDFADETMTLRRVQGAVKVSPYKGAERDECRYFCAGVEIDAVEVTAIDRFKGRGPWSVGRRHFDTLADAVSFVRTAAR